MQRAHPKYQEQVVPQVNAEIVAGMHKLILQQVCICHTAVSDVNLQEQSSTQKCLTMQLGKLTDSG